MRERSGALDFVAARAVDDAGRVLKASQERVALAGGGIGFEAQIGILHRAIDAALEGDAKEVAQAEVLPLHAPFVEEARLIGGDATAAPLNKSTKLRALGLRQRGDVRQDERLERPKVCGIQQPVMHHLEWDARLDQRLVPAQRMV